MLEFIKLGSCPLLEKAVQVTDKDNPIQALLKQSDILEQCWRYMLQLRATFPQGDFSIKKFSHDFGSYYEVVINYDDDDEGQEQIAFEIKEHLPEYWKDN